MNALHPRPPAARPPLALRLAGAVLLPLLLAACSATGADEPTRSAGQEGYVGADGTLTQIAPADRKALPPVAGTSLDGRPVSTTDDAGKVVVVNVWGSWCAPCRHEAPALQAASEATKGTARFVGINSRDNDPAQAKAFVRAHGITYPSIYDPSGSALLTFAGTLPPSAIPSTLILDRQGRLAVRVLGEVSERTLVAMVHDVAAGR